jgi:hypothetical protein
LNANLLRRWVVEVERTGALPVRPSPAPVDSGNGFVTVPLSSTCSCCLT